MGYLTVSVCCGMAQKLAMPKKAQRRNLRRKQTEEAEESKSHNSTSTEDNGSIASDLSGDSGLQSPGGSQSTTKSVRFANSSRSRARNPLRTNARGIPEPVLREIVTDVEAHGGLDYVLGVSRTFTKAASIPFAVERSFFISLASK